MQQEKGRRSAQGLGSRDARRVYQFVAGVDLVFAAALAGAFAAGFALTAAVFAGAGVVLASGAFADNF